MAEASFSSQVTDGEMKDNRIIETMGRRPWGQWLCDSKEST